MNNRQIKFRVWDKDLEEMYSINNLWFEENYSTTDYDYSKCAELNGCVLMQFTGLIDKNGIEIYEGDLLNYSNVEMPPNPWIVEWTDNSAAFVSVNKFNKECGFRTIQTILGEEVPIIVGNIYENNIQISNSNSA